MIKAILILFGLSAVGTILMMILMYILYLIFGSTRYVSLDDLEERIKKFNRENQKFFQKQKAFAPPNNCKPGVIDMERSFCSWP